MQLTVYLWHLGYDSVFVIIKWSKTYHILISLLNMNINILLR
jgi:hypothetical protein